MQGYLVEPQPVNQVYVAGGDTATITHTVELLRKLNLKPVLAGRNKDGVAIGWHTLADLYNHNLKALMECELLLALLDGNPTDNADTCVEMGLAYANGVPVLGLCTSPELRTSPMVVGMCRGDDQLAGSIEELKELVKEHIEMVSGSPKP
jgi:nucleoside 2-deoxyribosyltransferase